MGRGYGCTELGESNPKGSRGSGGAPALPSSAHFFTSLSTPLQVCKSTAASSLTALPLGLPDASCLPPRTSLASAPSRKPCLLPRHEWWEPAPRTGRAGWAGWVSVLQQPRGPCSSVLPSRLHGFVQAAPPTATLSSQHPILASFPISYPVQPRACHGRLLYALEKSEPRCQTGRAQVLTTSYRLRALGTRLSPLCLSFLTCKVEQQIPFSLDGCENSGPSHRKGGYRKKSSWLVGVLPGQSCV